MSSYNSYYQEDYDEALVESNDYYEYYEEDHEDGYDDESFEEGRGRDRRVANRHRRQDERRDRRRDRQDERRDRRRGGKGKPTKGGVKPAPTAAVAKGFNAVDEDISALHRDIKKAEKKQSNEQFSEMMADLMLVPKLITKEIKTDKGIETVVTGMTDHRLTRMMGKMMSNNSSMGPLGAMMPLLLKDSLASNIEVSSATGSTSSSSSGMDNTTLLVLMMMMMGQGNNKGQDSNMMLMMVLLLGMGKK